MFFPPLFYSGIGNPLLKFTKFQRGVMYEMYRQFGQ